MSYHFCLFISSPVLRHYSGTKDLFTWDRERRGEYPAGCGFTIPQGDDVGT